MSVVNSEKLKYDSVHHNDFQYGLGLRQVNDLKNDQFDFSNRFNEIVKQSKTSLDIACGGGTIMDYVDYLGCTPTGIDISESAIKKVDKSYTSIVGSCHQLPFKDNQFDLVYFLDGMEHIPIEIEIEAIHEAFRVSKNFVCHAIALESSVHKGVELHCNLKTPEEWRVVINEIANKLGWAEEMYYLRNNTVHLIYKK
jgi:ubiquinone/menaquinone biosynthesis C-methylase UbiE|tara:strand:+ start:138 stop:728 length:591 start_codon:yes stop_codon:yes gene_type:complete